MDTIFQFLKKLPVIRQKKRIGLALSGGATYGAAHVGVLKVLEGEGIQPDFVTGTSAGALVGAAYCAGIPVDTIASFFTTLDWPSLLRVSIRKHLSFFDTSPMENFIKQKIGDIDFRDLKIPFAVVACNICNGERVVLAHGPLAPAVRASAAIPGLFSPVDIEGRLLVDGGIVDNLPVEQVRAMGANYVIASDVSKRGNFNENPGNPFDVILSTFFILQSRAALVNEDQCECYIRPHVSQYSSMSFKDSINMMKAGEEAAQKMIPKLKRDLRK